MNISVLYKIHSKFQMPERVRQKYASSSLEYYLPVCIVVWQVDAKSSDSNKRRGLGIALSLSTRTHPQLRLSLTKRKVEGYVAYEDYFFKEGELASAFTNGAQGHGYRTWQDVLGFKKLLISTSIFASFDNHIKLTLRTFTLAIEPASL